MLTAVPAHARAADLVVGVVHDTDGLPVAGATVTLEDAAGGPGGTGLTAADGTFAIDAGPNAATVNVRCAYCLEMSLTRTPGAPVVAVIRRFAALRDRGISAADARVLPYAAATDLASLMPFVVTGSFGRINDRGLAGGYGAVVADGLPMYRQADGADLGTALPAHALATIQQTDPTHANAYAGYSAGGLFSIDTLDQSAGLVRADADSNAADAVLRAGNALRGVFATSGGANAATRAVVAGTLPALSGTLDLRGAGASAAGLYGNAVAATLTTPLRGSLLSASLSLTRTATSAAPENDAVAALSLHGGEVTYGVRAQRASAGFEYTTAAQADARAYVELLHDDGRTRILASLAAVQSGETYLRRSSQSGAVLPILGLSTRLGRSFSVHADSVDALLPTPLFYVYSLPNGTAVDRSHLIDAGIGFDDANRLRIDAMAFRQTVSGSGYGTTGGSGIATVWQIAPSLALRSWVLISHDGGYFYANNTGNFDRNATWITAGSVLRVDAIWRGGYLEGALSLPVGQARFVAGTRREGPNRVVTAGFSWP